MTNIRTLTAAGAVTAVALAAAVLVAGPAASAATNTVTVTGNTAAGVNQPGWLFNRDPATANPYEFNSAAASIGQGSLYVQPIGAVAANKFIGEFFANDFVADVGGFSYDFQVGPAGAATQEEHFYLNVYANFGESADDKFYDCRYNVVPTAGSTSGFTTVNFDPTQAYDVTTRGGASASPYPCPAVPADMDDLSAGSTIRAFALNLGDTSANDVGLDGYFDNVVYTVGGDTTVFDFEPVLTPAAKDECKHGGWQDFNTPKFKNQGDCVSFVASQGRSGN